LDANIFWYGFSKSRLQALDCGLLWVEGTPDSMFQIVISVTPAFCASSLRLHFFSARLVANQLESADGPSSSTINRSGSNASSPNFSTSALIDLACGVFLPFSQLNILIGVTWSSSARD